MDLNLQKGTSTANPKIDLMNKVSIGEIVADRFFVKYPIAAKQILHMTM